MKYSAEYDEKEGILRIGVLERYDVPTAQSFFKDIREKFGVEKSQRILAFVAEPAQEIPDKETRRLLRDEAITINWGKIAVWGAKPALKMVSKILMVAIGKKDIVGFFDKEADAIAWLKAEKKSEPAHR